MRSVKSRFRIWMAEFLCRSADPLQKILGFHFSAGTGSRVGIASTLDATTAHSPLDSVSERMEAACYHDHVSTRQFVILTSKWLLFCCLFCTK